MKTYLKIMVSAAVTVIAAASCTKNIAEESPLRTTFKLGVDQEETKLVYYDNKVEWATNDKLILFDSEGGKYISETAGSAFLESHEFIFNDWISGKTPAYTMFNFSSSGVPYAGASYNEGTISAIIPEKQIINDGSSFSQYGPVSVGTVVKSDEKFGASLKNVCGLLRFKLAGTGTETGTGIKSIIFSSVEGIDLAGKILIPTSSIDAGAPDYSVVEGSKSVVVSASGSVAENGCFESGVYMVSILPGVAFTPVISFLNVDGKVARIAASKQITVSRNGIVNLKTIDSGLSFSEPELPARFEVDLNFFNEGNVNPLGTFSSTTAEEGETYNYNFSYRYKGMDLTAELPFTIKGGGAYNYQKHSDGTYPSDNPDAKILYFAKTGGWIKLPAVPGRYLQSVSMTLGNKSGKNWQIMAGPGSGDELYTSGTQKATLDELATKTAAFDENSAVKPEIGKSYYIYLSNAASLNIYDIKLTYASVLKSDKIVGYSSILTNPFTGIESSGATAVENDEFTLGEYTFVSVGKAGFQWRKNDDGSGLWNRAGAGFLKLPGIEGYKLTSVYIKGGNAKAVSFRFTNSTNTDPLDIVPGGEVMFLASSVSGDGSGKSADDPKLDNTWTFTDDYRVDKNYYLYCKRSSYLAVSFLLTYTPVEFL